MKLHHAFEQSADHAPDASAIHLDGSTITYGQLERAANCLAVRLIDSGVRHEEFVGVLSGRSAQLPSAFLSILKAGAAYVPMAADLPAERLCDMASQCGMRRLVVLDDLPVPPALAALLEENAKPSGSGARVIFRPEPDDAEAAAIRPQPGGAPQDIAAVLFTSGSSGRPKGVLLSHMSALNMVQGHLDAQRITPQDRFLLSSSPSFILGFRELCLPMAAGAAYVPASRALIDNPPELIALMSRQRVSVALFTPSFLRLLNGAVPDGLRLIMTAGERPNSDDARHYARQIEYWNMHGATEMCGTICMHRVEPAGEGAIPSGKPFLNTAVHLLDGDGNDVPPGETGEIYVTGLGLSRGYLGQPELSARAFVDTRFGKAYRTNDIGRFRTGGILETLGRADDVVKVSGQAVSLSEIEQVLLRHPRVRRAAALLHEGRLLGFVEMDPGQETREDWRRFLSGVLPDYMLPADVLALPAMPISSAGKTDRKALVAIADGTSAKSRGVDTQQLPAEGAERMIARAWEDVIGVGPVLRHDNFYAIGGTSLLSIAVSQKLHAAGLAITPQMILASLTVAEIAARLGDWQQAPDGAAAEQERGKATLGQQDFWIAAELGMPSGASHVARTLRVRGCVPELAQWQLAWAALLRRHPALRTSFHPQAGGGVGWRIAEAGEERLASGFKFADGLSGPEAQEQINAIAAEPFDLQSAPLARAGLIMLRSPDEGALFWLVLHHAVADGPSGSVVVNDMLALLCGAPLTAAGNGILTAARAEEIYLGSTRVGRDRDYWQARLARIARRKQTALAPLLASGPTTRKTNGKAAPLLIEELDPATADQLARVAQRCNAGLHALLLTLLAHELRRRTGQADVLIGSGVTLRPPGCEAMAGHFVNIVPVDLERPGTRLLDDVARAQAALTEAVRHGEYPFSHMREIYGQLTAQVGEPARAPILETTLTANPSKFSRPGSSLDATRFTPFRSEHERAHVPAGLELAFSHEPLESRAEDQRPGLALSLAWNSARFAPSEARSLLQSFAGWARWLAADMSRAEAALPGLLPEEAELLAGFERGPRVTLPSARLDQIVADNARRTPDADAVVSEAGILSYAALDARANSIARALQDRDLQPGATVAVIGDVTEDLAVAALGVWKAGAVYLPLAHDLPGDRMAMMAEDAGVKVLLALGGVAVPTALAVITDVLRPEACSEPATPRPVALDAQAGAYTIYTSGTTGKPKGVTLTHAALVNIGLATLDAIGRKPGDRVAMVSTPSFDASLWELAMGLANGLPLVPVKQQLRDDPWAMKRYYRRLGVTIAFHAPSYLRVSEDQPFEGLRVLLTGGEAPTAEDIRRHAGQQLALWAAYGPSETCVLVSLGQLHSRTGIDRPVHAGRTLANAVISIRRTDGTRLPPGAWGEVWLGGIGVAKGYLNRPELTASAFIDTPDGRFYRSGDFGRWSADGLLELSGRIDDQVKLHGQRIEPEEIERALMNHPAVRAAVVMVDNAAAGTKLLRGFVVPTENQTLPGAAEWRAFLSGSLPAHMVPASVVPMSRIPLTPAGKLDRDSLRRATADYLAAQAVDGARTEAPQAGLESLIATLWADMFNAPVGRHDNFFALGGNSLLAVSMAHRLSGALGRPVAARMLFGAPTPAEFARSLEAETASPAGSVILDDGLATEGQREFWVAERAGLDTRGFIIPVHRVIAGGMPPPERWQEAWSRLVARHPALSSRFEEDAGGLLRCRSADVTGCRLETASCPDLAAALALIRAAQAEPISMARPPLWRAGLVHAEAGGEHVFWLALHHAVGDGHTISLLLRELLVLLDGACLPPAPGPGDLARQEQAYLASPACAADAQYWRQQFADVSEDVFEEWPLDRPRRADGETGSHRHQMILSPDVTAALRHLARGQHASLHALAIALLALEASRRGGRSSLIIGTPASIRETREEETIAGYGVNMLPLALTPPAGGSFNQLLRHCQSMLASALQHARYPFARIYHAFWKAFPGRRHPNRYPMFDLAVTENPQSGATAEGFRLRGWERTGESPHYEHTAASPGQDIVLTHELLPDGRLLLQLQTNSGLYERGTAEAWAQSLTGWARWLAADVKRAEVALPGLLPEESELLAGFEHGPAVARPALRLDQIVADHARRTPDAAAVVSEAGILSYAALDARAKTIAHDLQEKGLQPRAAVGVITGRSPQLPAAVLGLWKAGAVYVPLAEDLPGERMAVMAEDAGVACILVLDGLSAPEAIQRLAVPVMRLEAVLAGAAQQTIAAQQQRHGRDVAYILYTSGSTGRPKGTLVSHRAYINCLLGAGAVIGMTPEDRSLLLASPSFDVSLSDIGLPLAFGASLCPVDSDVLHSPSRFISLLAERGITIADMTPSYLRLLRGAEMPGLRALVTGGEPPNAADIALYSGRLAYYNAYGPTENAITSSMTRIRPGDTVTAGRPLANTTMQVRNAAGDRLPAGMLGEIWLSGDGLADGYLNRPDETGHAFVETADGRFYRSGDLGRWLPDGRMEIAGRRDDQVKLNGIRVELGEIEQCLLHQTGVAQAAVAAVKDGEQRRSLTAFVVAADDAPPPDAEALLGAVAQFLPAYMLPDDIVMLESLPLLPSGKIDRGALRQRIPARREERAFEEPATDLERRIATVWSDLLDCGEVKRDDNFFRLGGHSLLAIAATHRLERELGHSVPARELFAAPTPRQFAARVAALLVNTATAPDTSDRATENQKDFWIAEQSGFDTAGFNIELTLLAKGDVPGDDAWAKAWARLVERHASLRTGFFEDGQGELRCRVNGAVAASFAFATAPDEASALSHVRELQARPFTMGEPGLWRAGLIRTREDGKAIFWLALHHAIADGLSLGILVEDMVLLLRGAELPPRGCSFGEAAARQHAYLESPAAEEDATYWQDLIREAAEPLPDGSSVFDDWPLDTPRPPTRTPASHVLRRRLTAQEAEGLRKIARINSASLHALVLALLALEIRRRTGRSAFMLGTAVSGRERADEARTVANFVNLIPLPCVVTSGRALEPVLEAIQTSLSEGLHHARYPLSRIAQTLRRSLPQAMHPNRFPLFDFAVSENPGTTADAGGAIRFTRPEPLPGRDIGYQLRNVAPAQDVLLTHEQQPDGGLVLQLMMNASLYEAETARNWMEGLEGWARHLAQPARTAGSDFPDLLPEEEARLAAWANGPRIPLPDKRIDALFERTASHLPGAPAVVLDSQVMSYGELDRRANAIAHAILGAGCRPGSVVGVLTGRSPGLAEAFLAISKAGSCYLPLTSDLPPQRIAQMASEAGAGLVLCLDGTPLPEELARLGLPILRPEDLGTGWMNAHAHKPVVSHANTPERDPAYIIYTSGSTGLPKGVILTQLGTANLAASLHHAIRFSPGDRLLSVSSPAFDASISDWVMTWSTGAALVPVRDEEMKDIPAMRRKIARLGVTAATMSPSYLRLFEDEELASLHTLMTVGEAPIAADIVRYAGKLRYFNGYGPSEYTAATAIGVLTAGSRPSAGRPVANTSVTIRGPDLRHVPPGALGELWISGAGMGLGYIARPELTAERFIAVDGILSYRTGDLARWTASGELEIAGRSDSQVKLRGQRVELDEIGHAIASHPAARQGVAVVAGEAGAPQTLWGFVLLKEGHPEPSQAMWREHLLRRLPSYMAPSAVVSVPGIPVSLAGKIDRAALLKALPPPFRMDPAADGGRATAPPATETETRIAAVWQQILGVSSLGREDNFFEMGGDSLRAIAAIARLKKDFDCKINDLYENPVLADFARACKHRPERIQARLDQAVRLCSLHDANRTAFEEQRHEEMKAPLADYARRNWELMTVRFDRRWTYHRILLAGAAGYLGSYLLRELIEQSGCHVVAPVRAASPEAAKARLYSVLADYFGRERSQRIMGSPRLSIVAADLAQPQLGLSRAAFEDLGHSLDAIINSAANTRHYGHYAEFEAGNVDVTRNLLHLAKARGGEGPAHFHHVSTLSVLGKTVTEGFAVRTEYDCPPQEPDDNYYIRSKQAAERLVIGARAAGGHATIYRTGNIIAASDGASLQNNIEENAFFRMLKALVQVGCVPTESQIRTCSVDLTAAAILKLAFAEPCANLIHHVEPAHDKGLAAFLNAAPELRGRIREVTFADFAGVLKAALGDPLREPHAMQLIDNFRLLTERPACQTSRRLHVCCERTAAFLTRLGFTWSSEVTPGQLAMLAAASAGHP